MKFLPFMRRAAVVAVVLAGWGARARAAEFSVTNADDSGAGSLRQAVLDANAAPTDDIIRFNGNVFTGSPTITLTSGQIVVVASGALSISGPSTCSLSISGHTVSGNNISRLFAVEGGANLSLTGLTLTKSSDTAILCNGNLVATNCSFVNNSGEIGGAISNSRWTNLTLNNCTFANNSGRQGGAISNSGGGSLTVNNCTFVSNFALGGGAIANSGSSNINSSTFASNSASREGGAIENTNGTLNIISSIVVDNPAPYAPNIDGSPSFSDSNLVGGTAVEAGLQTDGNGKALLANNGGPTQTVALLSSSRAVDAGKSALATDQRGSTRSINFRGVHNAAGRDRSDIGAFELNESSSQGGPNFVVNTKADHNDGVCGPFDCTLREAVSAANDGPSDDTITFSGSILLDGFTLALTLGDLFVSNRGSLSISGPTARSLSLSIRGNPANDFVGYGVFYVSKGANVALTNLMFAESNNGHGGAIYNGGNLLVNNCGFRDNNGTDGGAINNNTGANLTVSNCTFKDNSAQNGGAIVNFSFMTVNNCTFKGNSASESGGAISSFGSVTVNSSTFAGNTAVTRGGAVFNFLDGTLKVSNCIMAGNNAPSDSNIAGPVSSSDHNLIARTAVEAGLQIDGNGEALLAANGGPTHTVALVAGSPAINSGQTELSVDQRGFVRPVGNADDIGAFEFVSPIRQVVAVSPQGVTNKVGDSRTFSLTVRDGDGTSDIREMWLLINTRLDWAEGATLIYFPQSGELYLRKGDTFLGPIKIGSAAGAGDVLDNGALRIMGSQVSIASADANTLTLSVPATVRDGLVGQNTLYGRVQDASGQVDPAAVNATGFVGFGPYTVTPQFQSGANRIPTLSVLSPKAANTVIPTTGTKLQTFVFYATDEDGIGDFDSLWFMVGKQRDWTGSATFVFLPRTRRLYLRSDDGQSFLGGGVIGTQGTIENSQVKVDLSQVQYLIYPDGKNVGLRLPLQPKAGLLGQNNIWLRVQDNSGATSTGGDNLGFVQSGTWNVTKQSGTVTGAAAPSAPGS